MWTLVWGGTRRDQEKSEYHSCVGTEKQSGSSKEISSQFSNNAAASMVIITVKDLHLRLVLRNSTKYHKNKCAWDYLAMLWSGRKERDLKQNIRVFKSLKNEKLLEEKGKIKETRNLKVKGEEDYSCVEVTAMMRLRSMKYLTVTRSVRYSIFLLLTVEAVLERY